MIIGAGAFLLGGGSQAVAQTTTGSGLNQGLALTGTQLLAVDVNGTTSTTGTTETQAAGTQSFQGFTVANTPNVSSLTIAATNGSGITTTVTAEGADSPLLIVSRNRNILNETDGYGNLYNDFINEPSNAANPTTGANALQIAFSGLAANTSYAFTFYALDPTDEAGSMNFGTGTVNSATSFTPGTTLGSVVWNTATQGTPASYDAFINPNPNFFSTTFSMTSNAAGQATVYEYATYLVGNNAWRTPGQSAGVFNGFVISSTASAPEPGSLGLLAAVLPLAGGIAVRRRRRH